VTELSIEAEEMKFRRAFYYRYEERETEVTSTGEKI
jgi:hypothetical protein